MHRSVRRMKLRSRITAGRYIHAQSPTNFATLYLLWWRLLINAIFSSGMLNNLQLNKLPTSISNDASTNIYYMNLCILHVNNVSVLEKWKLLSFNAAEKKTSHVYWNWYFRTHTKLCSRFIYAISTMPLYKKLSYILCDIDSILLQYQRPWSKLPFTFRHNLFGDFRYLNYSLTLSLAKVRYIPWVVRPKS